MRRDRTPSLTMRIAAIAYACVALCCWLIAWLVLSDARERMFEGLHAAALGEHAMIGGALSSYGEGIRALDASGEPDDGRIASGLTTLARYYTKDDTSIRLIDGSGRVLMSNMDDAMRAIEPPDAPPDGRRGLRIDALDDGRRLLLVSGWIAIGASSYRIDYAQDVTAALRADVEHAQQIALWMLGISAVLFGALYVGVRAALRPLRVLGAQARSIAQGEYGRRVPCDRSDEVGQLARDFNGMADAVQDRIVQLEHTAEARERLAANLAHELRTPLTSIVGYADLGTRWALDPERLHGALEYIAKEGRRLNALCERLLRWSQLQAESELSRAVVRASTALEHARRTLQPLLEPRAQRLDIACAVDLIDVDEALFASMIVNLAHNAAKASAEGAPIRVSLEAHGDDLLVTVRDEGCGIAVDELERVREPFYMVDKARSRAHDGAGLGLALCDAIASAHGGTLDMHSVAGRGTTVRVSLPGAVYRGGRGERDAASDAPRRALDGVDV